MENLKIEMLKKISQLPFDFSSIEIFKAERLDGYRFFPEIVDIDATFDGVDILVGGEAHSLQIAANKAISELAERAAMIAASRASDAVSSSNGWAAHPKPVEARQNAILEVIERDAVLAQWYSATPFLEIDPTTLPSAIKSWHRDQLSKSEFPILRVLISTEGLGPSVTCLFQTERGFGVSSHATKLNLFESIEGAIAEAARAAHSAFRRAYRKETAALFTGDASVPIGVGVHGVYYAYHEAFPDWMFGELVEWKDAVSNWRSAMQILLENDFEGFQYETHLQNPLAIGVATHPQAFEMKMGITDEALILTSEAAKRLGISKENLNLKPHLVA